jgi:hypothetical protein
MRRPWATVALPLRDGDRGLAERGQLAREERRSAPRCELEDGPADRENDEACEDECDEKLPRHVTHDGGEREFLPR